MEEADKSSLEMKLKKSYQAQKPPWDNRKHFIWL